LLSWIRIRIQQLKNWSQIETSWIFYEFSKKIWSFFQFFLLLYRNSFIIKINMKWTGIFVWTNVKKLCLCNKKAWIRIRIQISTYIAKKGWIRIFILNLRIRNTGEKWFIFVTIFAYGKIWHTILRKI
jgi:hypothetical protein